MASVVPNSFGDEDLQARLDRNAPFSQAQLLALLAALAAEVRQAHRQGRCHGAITPADIRFEGSGRVRLDGWGRDTTPDARQTSAYAPIERYVPVHAQGPWTDVYAIAAILWRAIAGGPPAPVLQRKGDVTLERLAPSGYEPQFLRGVDAALAIAPQRRPPDVDRWLAQLSPSMASSPANAAAAAPAAPRGAVTAAPASRAGRWPVAVLATALVATIAAAIQLAPRAASDAPAVTTARTPAAVPADRPLPPPRADLPPVPATGVDPAREAEAVAEAPPARRPAAATAAAPLRDAVAPAPVAPIMAARPTPANAAPQPLPAAEPSPPAPVETVAVAFDPPLALLRRADRGLRRLYADYDRLNDQVARSYRKPRISDAAKEQIYRESRSIQAALTQLRDDRNSIAQAETLAVATARYAVLSEEMTRVRDRMEMVRRSL